MQVACCVPEQSTWFFGSSSDVEVDREAANREKLAANN